MMTLEGSDGESYRWRQKGLDQERSSLPCDTNEKSCYHLTDVISFHLPNRSLVYICISILKMGNLRFK